MAESITWKVYKWQTILFISLGLSFTEYLQSPGHYTIYKQVASLASINTREIPGH